ncbi:hypothetical protein BDV96DRAFT_601186 [Lophiotrema nucula]|uniref:MADS-box domain-containing protein n=1 Tax=Lophiotrema nucula TaxID=690887 RepID=A0A6A5Z5L9_9PLEO|nr:hypothetical protein BDV96DRAFT_601186 [Lophiotrema nucula]
MVRLLTRYGDKQLRKRLIGLENKAHEYGQLGVNVALVLEYPGREGGYSYITSEDFLRRIAQVIKRAHPKSINKSPNDIRISHTKTIPRLRRLQKKDKEKDADEELGHTNPEASTTDCIVKSPGPESFFPEPPVLNIPRIATMCFERSRGNA